MINIAHVEVKVRLKQHVTSEDFWRATYSSDSNLGIRLLPYFDNMKRNYLCGKLYKYGSLEVSIPIKYYDRKNETVNDDFIEYAYIKDGKNIWEIVE